VTGRSDHPQHGIDLLIFHSYQDRDVPARQKPSHGADPGDPEPFAVEALAQRVGVFILDNREQELHHYLPS